MPILIWVLANTINIASELDKVRSPGFENLQSSQNRLPLDRNDGLNSAVSNERDLGVFFSGAQKNIGNCFQK